ncbi:MAG: hypothetical protein JWO76_414 [Nocardioides sp.]|nr:hypothetical protein [Nocardioides sp.]
MNGDDVVRDTADLAPRVQPFLEPGEQFQVGVRASSRPAQAVQLAIAEAWPFLAAKDKFLLVATDRRWLVLESKKEQLRGDLTERGSFDRHLRIEPSWFTRFEGFDRPYSVSPFGQLWAVAANDALDALEAGRPWSLEEAAGRLGPAENSKLTEALAPAVMRLGRFVPRRRGHFDEGGS